MIEEFAALVPTNMLQMSGVVFYSGRSGFSGKRELYILGLNPGGDPTDPRHETVAQQIQRICNDAPRDYSSYRDDSWGGRPPGTAKMQPRILHMLNRLGLSPGEVPASNLVFLRSKRKATFSDGSFKGSFADAVTACWPFHKRVIETLQVRVVLCLGGDAAKPVRDHFNANELVGEFLENNNRRWASKSYRNADGLTVISVTHPSIADWTNPATDPTVLVLDALR